MYDYGLKYNRLIIIGLSQQNQPRSCVLYQITCFIISYSATIQTMALASATIDTVKKTSILTLETKSNSAY